MIDIGRVDRRWPSVRTLRTLSRRAVDAAIEEGNLEYMPDAELSIVFTNDENIRDLNHKWRGRDRATNVLSFPAGQTNGAGRRGPLLGDIVLSYETIEAEASLDGMRFDDHLIHMIVHGFLHLFGYDHESREDASTMEEVERRALARLAIADPYQ